MPHSKPTKRLPCTIAFAQELRTTQTQMEKFLWKCLRGRRFHNLKFRRQVPIGPYIADFYCAEKNLIVEVDGGVHALKQAHDHHRDVYMQQHGYIVVRISNRFLREWQTEAMQKIGRAVGFDYDGDCPLPSREDPL